MRFSLIGNSGSGKSTYAKSLAERHGLSVLDLDQVAWEPDAPTTLRQSDAAAKDVRAFCQRDESWVVEGCYANLIEATLALNPVLIFLDPGVERCLSNCRNRPWEPTKYASKEAQDENLEFLLNWVTGFYVTAIYRIIGI